MRSLSRLAVALAGVVTVLVPRADATSLSMSSPEQVAAGWIRIAGHYEGVTGDPSFRAVARCGAEPSAAQVLAGRVYISLAEHAVWIDLPGTPEQLAPGDTTCADPALSVEMLTDATVVASAPVAPRYVASNEPEPAVVETPVVKATPRFRLQGEKYAGPFGKRTETGVEWSLDSRVSLQLNYERTAQAPMMPFDHDDGILTRFCIGF